MGLRDLWFSSIPGYDHYPPFPLRIPLKNAFKRPFTGISYYNSTVQGEFYLAYMGIMNTHFILWLSPPFYKFQKSALKNRRSGFLKRGVKDRKGMRDGSAC